ncbi:hypothetical protein [Francisella sp. LA112445]|nr:hypothetical protein [Francisella sp. LA112445]
MIGSLSVKTHACASDYEINDNQVNCTSYKYWWSNNKEQSFSDALVIL